MIIVESCYKRNRHTVVDLPTNETVDVYREQLHLEHSWYNQ